MLLPEKWYYVIHTMYVHTIHSPQLDLAIISGRYEEGEVRMKGHPVHTTIVTLTTRRSRVLSICP